MMTNTDKLIQQIIAVIKDEILASDSFRERVSGIIAQVQSGPEPSSPSRPGKQPLTKEPQQSLVNRFDGDGPVEEITEQQSNKLAEKFIQSLTDEGRARLIWHVVELGGAGLPKELDTLMLQDFKRTYKRFATESEKIHIRTAIINAVKDEEEGWE